MYCLLLECCRYYHLHLYNPTTKILYFVQTLTSEEDGKVLSSKKYGAFQTMQELKIASILMKNVSKTQACVISVTKDRSVQHSLGQLMLIVNLSTQMLDLTEYSMTVVFFEMQVFLKLLKKKISILPQLKVFQVVMKHFHFWWWQVIIFH